MQIDHIPNEKRPTNTVWWVGWALVAFCWFSYLFTRSPDWWSISLGAFSMAILATWAIDVTGNKVPESWSRQPPRSGRS